MAVDPALEAEASALMLSAAPPFVTVRAAVGQSR